MERSMAYEWDEMRGGENSLRSVQQGVTRRLQRVSAALRGW